MDLAAARADGISFFTHKATEANNTQHTHYGDGMNRARAAGIPFLGPYHVVRTLDVNAQVDYHLAYVNTQTPWWTTHPGWFFQADLEKWSYDAVAPTLGVQFAAEIERRTGRRCILYAPQWAYGDSIGGNAPLWASAYGPNPAGRYQAIYPGDTSPVWGAYSGRVPVILQFGSRATIGRQIGCDINAFRGTTGDFAALIRGEAPLGGGTPIPGDDMFEQADRAALQDTRTNAAEARKYLALMEAHILSALSGQQPELDAINTNAAEGRKYLAVLESHLAGLIGADADRVAAAVVAKLPPGQPVDVAGLAKAVVAELGTQLAKP
jgi:hypothetical protein